jgi:uncharacterized protein HemX
MEAAVWTLIVVLAAVAFGNVWWLGSKIDNLLLTVGLRFDQTNLRIDAVGQRQDETIIAVAALGQQIAAQSRQFDQIDEQLAAVEEHRRGA